MPHFQRLLAISNYCFRVSEIGFQRVIVSPAIEKEREGESERDIKKFAGDFSYVFV